MDRAKLIDAKSYREFAGASWPSYEDFINNVGIADPAIQQELDQFIGVMQDRYSNLNLGRGEELAEANQQRQGQQFYNKNVAPGNVCRIPWNTLGINTNGEVFICSSPSWIPKFVGNILETDDIYTVLNSDTAKSIRQEILAGRYYYCNERLCSYFGKLNPQAYSVDTTDTKPLPLAEDGRLLVKQIPRNLIFDFDYTCNFKCPSCRTELLNWNTHHLIRPINDRIVEKIKHLVIDQIGTQAVSIRWAGGEPFLSEPYLELFDYIIASGKTNIQNVIQTNGSYLKSRVVERLLPYISELRISFDAATAETYAKTRVNGNWNKLLENVKHIKEVIDWTGAQTQLTADYVVQLDNYQEIPAFVEICRGLGIGFNLQKMWNWGTWSDDVFAQNNVYNPDHPKYEDLKQYFKLAGQQVLNG